MSTTAAHAETEAFLFSCNFNVLAALLQPPYGFAQRFEARLPVDDGLLGARQVPRAFLVVRCQAYRGEHQLERSEVVRQVVHDFVPFGLTRERGIGKGALSRPSGHACSLPAPDMRCNFLSNSQQAVRRLANVRKNGLIAVQPEPNRRDVEG